MSKGAIISKEGVDIARASQSDLVLDSTRPGSVKLHDTIELTIVSNFSAPPALELTASAPHNLGYIPLFFASFHASGEDSSKGEEIWYKVPFFDSHVRSIKVYADKTHIYASAVTLEAVTYTYKISVFREKMVA